MMAIKVKSNSKYTFLLVLCMLFIRCIRQDTQNKDSAIFVRVINSDIKLEIDSVVFPPQLVYFPLRLKLTNYSDKKVILFFDTISQKSMQLRDSKRHKILQFVTDSKDTFFLGSFDKYLIFKEKSITSFDCRGFYGFGNMAKKGYFKDFLNFPKGKVLYLLDSIPDYDIRNELSSDTILVPHLLQANTDSLIITNENFISNDFQLGRSIQK